MNSKFLTKYNLAGKAWVGAGRTERVLGQTLRGQLGPAGAPHRQALPLLSPWAAITFSLVGSLERTETLSALLPAPPLP